MKIAIIVCFNDCNFAVGTKKSGIKSELSYLCQFLMLYYSIKENWHFNYDIYLFHSLPISEKTKEILSNCDVKVVNINTTNLLIRPETYLEDISCDYRLVLDCDMIALNEPTFNFDYDAQAMYGDFTFQSFNNKLFENLDIIEPKLTDYEEYEIDEKSSNELWSTKNLDLLNKYYINELDYNKKFYPIFNHGAIFVKNKYSKEIGEKLLLYKKIYKTNNGQNVIGYIINDVTKGNWTHFNKGFNFTLNMNRQIKSKMEYLNNNKIELLHYIYVPKKSIYYQKYIKKYHDIVIEFMSKFNG